MFLLAAVSPARTKASVNSCVLSAGRWMNVPVQQQTGTFRITYTASTSAGNVDGVTGLSSGLANDFSDLAAVIRFNSSGAIDAMNGSTYTAASTKITVNIAGRYLMCNQAAIYSTVAQQVYFYIQRYNSSGYLMETTNYYWAYDAALNYVNVGGCQEQYFQAGDYLEWYNPLSNAYIYGFTPYTSGLTIYKLN